MPRGQPGSITHGRSAYFSGRCKCEICTEAMREYRRQRRASGAETKEDWRRWKATWRARTGKH